jgi:hypothetical protein
MKVVCINNDGYGGALTFGKTYDVIYISMTDCYKIINDKSNIDWFYKDWFKSLNEIRMEKIDKLLS